MSKHDGGPAFPVTLECVNEINRGRDIPLQPQEKGRILRGMSLRDYFAGQVMAALIESMYQSSLRKSDEIQDKVPELTALIAYRVADAMLAEPEKAQARKDKT